MSETAEQREVLLQKRRAANKRQRSMVASETPEQKRARLDAQKKRDQLKVDEETPEQRAERLQHKRAHA